MTLEGLSYTGSIGSAISVTDDSATARVNRKTSCLSPSMRPLSPNSPPPLLATDVLVPSPKAPLSQPQPSFGANWLTSLGNRYVDAYEWVGATRAREMIGEDFLGNGVLRTLSDAARGLVFGTGHLNWVLGRERITREASSILTDNVSAGVMAFALGSLVDRHLGTLTNSNVHLGTVSLVREHLPKASSFDEVLSGIRDTIATHHRDASPAEALPGLLNGQQLSQLLTPTPGKYSTPACNPESVQSLATNIARALKLRDFHLTIPFPNKTDQPPTVITQELPRFLEDLALLQHGLSARPWDQAAATLQQTHRWKSARIGLMAASLGLTMAVPHANKWLTRKLNGIDYYPGDEGLANAPRTRLSQQGYQGTGEDRQALAQPHPLSRPDWRERLFPFVTEQWRQGNPLPALGAAVPLLFASGLFRTGARQFVVPALKAFEWRLPAALNRMAQGGGASEGATWMKGLPARQWVRDWAGSLDYERGFPWTTQQQMAMLFAGLITSRIASARSANEYRERTVDGVLGWGLWILGSPVIRPLLGKHLFQAEKFELLGPDRSLRTSAELAAFAKDALDKKGLSLEKAQRQLSVVQSAAFGLNVVLMGVVEPFISMMTTLAYNRRGTQTPPPDVSNLLKHTYPAPPSMGERGVFTLKPSAELSRELSGTVA